jgi:hypothetical protein
MFRMCIIGFSKTWNYIDQFKFLIRGNTMKLTGLNKIIKR